MAAESTNEKNGNESAAKMLETLAGLLRDHKVSLIDWRSFTETSADVSDRFVTMTINATLRYRSENTHD
jgi:hypothetical protein